MFQGQSGFPGQKQRLCNHTFELLEHPFSAKSKSCEQPIIGPSLKIKIMACFVR